MTGFKPMLAGKVDFSKLVYPVLGSPKLDGIRASVVEGRLLTRTLKEVPNRHIFEMLSQSWFDGLDGELIVGEPNDPACYRSTVSGVMTHGGAPEFSYHVFDHWLEPSGYQFRMNKVMDILDTYGKNLACFKIVKQQYLENETDVEIYESEQVALGYEGIMLRSLDSPYKFGRSTVNEGYLLKVKRFEDSEGVLIGMDEEERNDNELTTDERGYAKRTSHKENKIGKDRMGAAVIRDCVTGIVSKIGTGFDAAERDWFWEHRERLVSEHTILKYRFFKYGIKDLPRHSSYLGFRPLGS